MNTLGICGNQGIIIQNFWSKTKHLTTMEALSSPLAAYKVSMVANFVKILGCAWLWDLGEDR